MGAARVQFRDVKAEILRRIRAGEWAPGALLPGEVELATEFGCARATVNRALRELAEDGVIDRRRKAGTRVKLVRARHAKFTIPLVRAEVEATGAAYRYTLITRDICPPPDWLAAQLGLKARARMLHVTCMHFANNAPFQYEDRWINIAAVPGVEAAELEQISPNEWLVDAVPFTDVDLSFSAIAASETLARYLHCQPATPLFQAERTTWLDGMPVTHAVLSFAPGYRMTTRY
tara:strand:+ start:284 stop:982 length:699 start_codon:yes stop_codon:yes gene_type:complete